MKIAVAIAVSVLAHAVGASGKGEIVGFGPGNCVMLSRSAAGSCVIATDCEGTDISHTEFAFDCVGQGGDNGIVRHSFGVGGFEASEEFDTEVKCGRCDSPSPIAPAGHRALKKAHVQASFKPIPASVPPPPPAPTKPSLKKEVKVMPANVPGAVSMSASSSSTSAIAAAGAKATAAANAKAKFWPFTSWNKPKRDTVKYGPKGCVSTYKSEQGHCVISTACKGVDISNYEFGVVCVDKRGSPVKHLFGKDSFDAEEQFDTLIKCEECLGLEEIPDETRLFGEVATMSKDIQGLKAELVNVSTNVKKLYEEVFPKPLAAAPAPAPAAAKAPANAEADTASLVRLPKAHRHHTDHASIENVQPVARTASRNLRHSHRRHHRRHHRREAEDDDDDDDDDRHKEQEVQYVAWSEFNGDHARAAAKKATAAVSEDSDDDDEDEDEDHDDSDE